MEDSGKRPYVDLETGTNVSGHTYVVRKFEESVDGKELYWHRDDEARAIVVMECGDGWQAQLDNQLPISLQPGSTLFINRHEWHRVIKGSGNLLVKILKYGQ